MPFKADRDYWIEVPVGRYRVGLLPEEARELADQSATWAKQQGIDLSPNEGKMLRKAAEMLDTTGNAPWAERYLCATYPARELELAAFAIARRPVTSREYKQFMAETGETEGPHSWRRDPANRADDVVASGVPWAVVRAFAQWAGARLPFEHEWERAVRGADHRLFPWGNEHQPIGARVLTEGYPRVLPASLTRNADGLEGAVCRHDEWCADYWSGEGGEPWGRVLRGGTSLNKVVPSGVTRAFGDPFTYTNELAVIRLARADGRQIPGLHPATPAYRRAGDTARTFETRVLVPALDKLRQSALARDHTIEIEWSGHFDGIRGALKLAVAAMGGAHGVRAGIPENPNQWAHGRLLAATSRETLRRTPQEHGIYIWTIQYRLGEDGKLRARPVVVFRMAFDKGLHRFENRFRPNEVDTPVEQITEEMVRASVLDAFQFYEIHADSDENPFKS